MSDKRKLKVQVLIFDRKTFKNRKQIKDWIIKNNYKLLKYRKQPIVKKDSSWVCVQRDCCRFKKRTMTTRYIRKGVKGVYGKLK